ncbi:MAG: ATP-binding cassette domain-containing protein, partial [bacterium]|nr:ATP-binding cassette domain-containing protein [bacterium]
YHGMVKRYEKFVSEMVAKPPAAKSLNLKSNLDEAAKRKTALHLINLNKSYKDKVVLKNLGVHIFCGDKIAINAPNGSGKSTLLNIIAGRTKADSGEVYIGPELKMGCYTQEHQDVLDENLTMTEEVQKNMPFAWQQALGYLKRFMFTEAQINGQIKYLSGGQKSRLQLAKFLSVNPDILVLDEPTNHLDLKTVISLEKFLKDYKGTIVLVSHDRELVNKVANKKYLLVDGVLKLENNDNYETGISEK